MHVYYHVCVWEGAKQNLKLSSVEDELDKAKINIAGFEVEGEFTAAEVKKDEVVVEESSSGIGLEKRDNVE